MSCHGISFDHPAHLYMVHELRLSVPKNLNLKINLNFEPQSTRQSMSEGWWPLIVRTLYQVGQCHKVLLTLTV